MMKKFCVALLAAAMVAGSALCASAMDVKFSGSYYVQGNYANNWAVGDEDTYSSSADYGQRLRMGMEFKIAEGLTLATRMDALEGIWGQSFGTYGAGPYNRSGNDESNISFDRAAVNFAVPFGKFRVGRWASTNWGTGFGDSDFDSDGIHYIGTYGPVTFGALVEKIKESYNPAINTNVTDADADNYHVYGMYKWNSGVAGLKFLYQRDASNRVAAVSPYTDRRLVVQPYGQATFGPVFVEAEINWFAWGDREYDDATPDQDYDNGFNAYVHAKGDFGPAYVGGLYAFSQGQDLNESDITSGPSGGVIWNPTLIMWNEFTNKWLGNLGTANTAGTGSAMTNAHLFQIYGGYKPIPKLDLKASVAYAMADENVATADDEPYGTELDLTAAYKIYDNLTYTVGAGYLWAGDYFEGNGTRGNGTNDDTYLLMHRLDLTF